MYNHYVSYLIWVRAILVVNRSLQIQAIAYPGSTIGYSLTNYQYHPTNYSMGLETKMTKLTLQEQMLKAGLVSSKKMAKVQRTAKKSRVQARNAREAVEANKKNNLNVISS